MNWLTEFYAKHPEYRYLPVAKRTRGSVHFKLAPGLYEAHFLSFPAFERLADGRKIPASKLTSSLRLMQGMLRSPRALARLAFTLPFGTTFTDGYGGDVTTYVDTFVASAAADTNYGTTTPLQFLTGGQQQSLLMFTLSSLTGATVTSSTLYIYEKGWGTAGYSGAVHRILVANSGWTEAGATYNHAVGTTDWAGGHTGCGTSGTDYNATAIGTWTGAGNAGGTEEAITLNTTQAEGMIAANYGLVLVTTSGSIQYVHSSDEATTGLRPKLVVVYTTATVKPWYAYAQQ